MVEVQVSLEEEMTFFKNNSDDTGTMDLMEISSSSEGETSMGIEIEDPDILQGDGGWPETAMGKP